MSEAGSFEAAVVIPAHDALPDVLAAVESALSQTLRPREVIVVDDSSSDGTGETVERSFGAAVQVIKGRFGSAAAARNAGWRQARAAWIAFLDADDLWFPEKLATAAAALESAPAAAWFFSDGTFRAEDGTMSPSWLDTFTEFSGPYEGQPVAELFEVNFVLTSSVVVRLAGLERTGGFDERMTHAEDLDLWIRLAREWPAAGSGQALVRYQHLPTGLSRQIEHRLMGDVTLFERLSRDPGLAPPLRMRARQRLSMARYKLAVTALREGRQGDARAHLRHAWLFPGRAIPVVSAWAVSLLPAHWIGRLRRQHWATRSVGRRMTAGRRVVLRAPDARSGAMPGGRS
jgi:glycosyltransferase involved in cell wall biosynthesis